MKKNFVEKKIKRKKKGTLAYVSINDKYLLTIYVILNTRHALNDSL